ncbi:MAG: polysaccharide pyruvyl transferase family protein [Acidobacteria bacterium]|nr:polysaccharide pyruvyl transferase family protein [Acidobacteriota bacterium]
MKDHEWQIGLFGTFDVENYGDLLFPLIAEKELSERLGKVNLRRFSYHAKTTPDWPYIVTSLTQLPEIAATLDAILIGGGFIVRFDKDIAPGYGSPTPMIHHPTGYWLSPALIALQHSIPLIWSAPGMHCNDIPAWAEPLMELALTNSRYVTVRDEPSQAALARFAKRDQIAVMPDTGFGISRLLNERQPSAEFRRLRNDIGLSDPYIIVQSTGYLSSFLGFVKQHSRRLKNIRFLVLPMAPVLGEHEAILGNDLPGQVRLPVWPHPLLLAEFISQAAAVVGYSYHLAITALACGVPVFYGADLSVGKYTALSGFETIYPLPEASALNSNDFLQRLGKTLPEPLALAARNQLATHWDRVAAEITSGATDTQPAVNRFWQALPGLLESAATGRESIPHPSAAENAEPQGRITELATLLRQAHTEIVVRDERIALLHNSPSMKVTAPLRFLMRKMKRLVGK